MENFNNNTNDNDQQEPKKSRWQRVKEKIKAPFKNYVKRFNSPDYKPEKTWENSDYFETESENETNNAYADIFPSLLEMNEDDRAAYEAELDKISAQGWKHIKEGQIESQKMALMGLAGLGLTAAAAIYLLPYISTTGLVALASGAVRSGKIFMKHPVNNSINTATAASIGLQVESYFNKSSEEKLDIILNELKEMKDKKSPSSISRKDEMGKDLQKKMEKMEESLEEIKKMMMFTMQSKSSEKSVISTDSNLSSTSGISKEEMEEMLEAHYKRVSMMAFKRESTIIGEIWKLARGEAMFTEEWLDKFVDAIDGDDRFELIMSDSFYREWAAIMRHFGL